MRYKYKTMKMGTVAEVKLAEQLQARGWRIISVGFLTVTMEKAVRQRVKQW